MMDSDDRDSYVWASCIHLCEGIGADGTNGARNVRCMYMVAPCRRWMMDLSVPLETRGSKKWKQKIKNGDGVEMTERDVTFVVRGG